ncbi:hypothetical protein [Desulfococcus sp.]|uniref:hypothetical protein n=1 Tax=Desulfococcus sp. TaxID=2025834 RepID=UPI003593B515
MIEGVDEKLVEWVGGLLGDVEISLGAPEEKSADAVGIYLMDILPSSPAHVTRRAPLQVMLRYLFTAWAEKPRDAHNMLSTLLFAAMEHPEYEVDLEEVPAQVWRAFGVRPRPSFKIRLPLRVERTDRTAHRVGGPIELRRAPLSGMQGVVTGPGGIPIANAQVALPACRLAVVTDSRGRFAFDAVPALSSAMQVRVLARGREMVRPVEQKEMNAGELMIHFDPFEP